MNDRRTLVTLLTMVSSTLMIRHEVSEASYEVWWQCLLEYDDEVVSRAFMAHLKDPAKGSFFPAPADIIRNANDIRRVDRLNAPNPLLLAGPKIPPRPWVRRMVDRLMVLSATHKGLPWPTEEAKKIFEDAKREQQQPDEEAPA